MTEPNQCKLYPITNFVHALLHQPDVAQGILDAQSQQATFDRFDVPHTITDLEGTPRNVRDLFIAKTSSGKIDGDSLDLILKMVKAEIINDIPSWWW